VKRRSYAVSITVNGQHIKRVIIDPHYELKHAATITDQLILELVGLLDGGDFVADAVEENFEYYVTENLILGEKKYRLIWLIEKEEFYIGVINAYRRRS
jgi:hypothetical protein